ncbi:MAG TPA: Rrf2 family transcriptional regulator [Saprospiraceae bacterium]|nr:Rrf2 family transcriptional regulator [Saprospiraceae bacterium]HMQ81246.1 Rrf2 family transcriptional regulator [Saprospiraceae bacterium]
MKISAQEEYGLRVLLRIGESDQTEGLSIAQLSDMEGMSSAYVAKLTRNLRLAGFIQSTRGQKGGYILAKPADEIMLNEVLKSLGGTLYDESFCKDHSGVYAICTNSVSCSVRSIWKLLQLAVDHVLTQISLEDILQKRPATSASVMHTIIAQLEQDERFKALLNKG